MNNKNPIHNKKGLAINRKALRNNATSAEAILWTQLKNSQLEGRKFRRQHSVGGFILDFYCAKERLAIELDGQDHYTTSGNLKDQERTAYLEANNIKVLRFENKVVFINIEQVLEEIRAAYSSS